MRFRYLLIFLFFIFCMVPAVVITIYSYSNSIETSRHTAIKDLTIASSRALNVIRYDIQKVVDSLDGLAENPAFALLGPRDQSETLLRYREQNPLFSDLYFADRNGIIIGSTDRRSIGNRINDEPLAKLINQYGVMLTIDIDSPLTPASSTLMIALNLNTIKKHVYLAEQPGPREDFLPFTIKFDVSKPIRLNISDSTTREVITANNLLNNSRIPTWEQEQLYGDTEILRFHTEILDDHGAVWSMTLTADGTANQSAYKVLLYRNIVVLCATTIIALLLIRIIGNLLSAPEQILLQNLYKEPEQWKPLPSYASSSILKISHSFDALTKHLYATDKRTLSLSGRSHTYLSYIHRLSKSLLSKVEEDKTRRDSLAELDTLLMEPIHYQSIEAIGYEMAQAPIHLATLCKEVFRELSSTFPEATFNIGQADVQRQSLRGDSTFIQSILINLAKLLLQDKQAETVKILIDDAAPHLHAHNISLLCSVQLERKYSKSQFSVYSDALTLEDYLRSSHCSIAQTLAYIHLMNGNMYVEYDGESLIGVHATLEISTVERAMMYTRKPPIGKRVKNPFYQYISRLHGGSLPPLSLLLVDDNMTNLRLYREMLEEMGHAVTTASDGRQALYEYGNTHFDCILMDCNMPIIDGYDTASAIREIEEEIDEHMPIIAMSNGSSVTMQSRCDAVGIDGHLLKPVVREELVKVLEKVITT